MNTFHKDDEIYAVVSEFSFNSYTGDAKFINKSDNYTNDDFEKDRANTLALFKACGFEIFQNKTWKKFNQDVEGVIVKKVL